MSCVAVAARKSDIARFEGKARRGEIPAHAVGPLAVVFAAMRKAQVAIGPGHSPMDAMFEAMPEEYRRNWLKKTRKHAA